MKSMKRGVAVLLALLLMMPESPVSMGRMLVTEAAEETVEAGTEAAEAEVLDSADGSTDEGASEETSPVKDNGESFEVADTGSGETQAEDGTVAKTEVGESPEGLGAVEESEPLLPEDGGIEGDGGQNEAEDAVDDGLDDGMAEKNPPLAEEGEGSSKASDALEELPTDNPEKEAEPDSSNEVEGSGDVLQPEESMAGEDQPEDGVETGQNLKTDLQVDYAENIIASGVDGNITWTLDSDGLLTVSGTGDFSENPNLWNDYRDSITSAKFDVTGMTNVHGVFSGWHLTSLDLSGFDTSNITDMSGMFYGCVLTSLDLSGFDTSNVTDMSEMFSWSNLASLDLSSFDTSNVTDMSHMFSYSGTTSLDLSGFDTRNVTDMSQMFYYSDSTSLDLRSFDTRNVTDMEGMFGGTLNLTSLNLSSFDTSSVTNMEAMFSGCRSTSLDLSSFDTSSVTDMGAMFSWCPNLTSLDLSGFDTSNVTNMGRMFESCSNLLSLNLEGFDTSNVTGMWSMFADCSSLTNLDLSGFDTRNVTSMNEMFFGCSGLTSLDLRSFDTSNVTGMSCMFGDCINLTSLDLSSFDMGNATMGDLISEDGIIVGEMLNGCVKLTTIQAPRNLKQPAALPEVAGTAWRLPDGTEVTQLPQGLSESILVERYDTDSTSEPTDLWFQVTGATGHSRYGDTYIAENSDQDILDTLFAPFYENAYQTLFINDSGTDLAALAPTFETSTNTGIYVQGQEQQMSGESIQNFSKGSVMYTATQHTGDGNAMQRNYSVAFVKKESGPRLFVNGPGEREIFLTDYFDNQHDILIANVGDAQLTGIKAELLDAVNVKLDNVWTVSSTLEPFAQVPGEGEPVDEVMTNFSKVRLVPDGEGEISGTLKITADGQEPVYIKLTGYSSNPRIITTTTDLNMDDVIRVKYVPYSYTVETNNEYEWNKVTFTIESGELAKGLQMYPATGEIYGVPLEAGEFPITVKATFSRPEFLPSYAQLTLIVKENTDGNVNVATDAGYDLVQRVQDIVLDSMPDSGSQTMVSLGEYAEFLDVYLDGEKLSEGDDYNSESGSTRITIRSQTLAGKGVGHHTLGIEFRTRDTHALRRAAQNYTVTQAENRPGNSGSLSSGNSGNSGSPGDSGSHSGEGAGSREDSLYETNAEVAETVVYTVQPGDSLWRISLRFYGTGTLWRRIFDDNISVIWNPNRIYAGQRLVIRLTDSSRTVVGAEPGGAKGRIYVVMLGDDLWSIAKKFYGDGRLWEKIYQANKELILNPKRIYAGQRIVIPAE